MTCHLSHRNQISACDGPLAGNQVACHSELVSSLGALAALLTCVVLIGCGGGQGASQDTESAAKRLAAIETQGCLDGDCKMANVKIESWLREGRIDPKHADGAYDYYYVGCRNCHTYRNTGTKFAGDLTQIGRRRTRKEITAILRCPACVTPGSPMPSFRRLPRGSIDRISAFLAASR
jgi:hypothetical protein